MRGSALRSFGKPENPCAPRRLEGAIQPRSPRSSKAHVRQLTPPNEREQRVVRVMFAPFSRYHRRIPLYAVSA